MTFGDLERRLLSTAIELCEVELMGYDSPVSEQNVLLSFSNKLGLNQKPSKSERKYIYRFLRLSIERDKPGIFRLSDLDVASHFIFYQKTSEQIDRIIKLNNLFAPTDRDLIRLNEKHGDKIVAEICEQMSEAAKKNSIFISSEGHSIYKAAISLGKNQFLYFDLNSNSYTFNLNTPKPLDIFMECVSIEHAIGMLNRTMSEHQGLDIGQDSFQSILLTLKKSRAQRNILH